MPGANCGNYIDAALVAGGVSDNAGGGIGYSDLDTRQGSSCGVCDHAGDQAIRGLSKGIYGEEETANARRSNRLMCIDQPPKEYKVDL